MDEDLIEGIIQKDEESIKRFVQIYQDRVYNQARRILGNDQDAEEASQDIFLKAIGKINDFRRQSKLATWLYRITYTTCLDVLKKRKRRPPEEAIDEDILPSWSYIENVISQMEQIQQRAIIDRSITRLAETDALLIDLYHLQEQSIQEISEITEMTKEAVKVRLFRARKKLAVFLNRSLPMDTIKEIQNEGR